MRKALWVVVIVIFGFCAVRVKTQKNAKETVEGMYLSMSKGDFVSIWEQYPDNIRTQTDKDLRYLLKIVEEDIITRSLIVLRSQIVPLLNDRREWIIKAWQDYHLDASVQGSISFHLSTGGSTKKTKFAKEWKDVDIEEILDNLAAFLQTADEFLNLAANYLHTESETFHLVDLLTYLHDLSTEQLAIAPPTNNEEDEEEDQDIRVTCISGCGSKSLESVIEVSTKEKKNTVEMKWIDGRWVSVDVLKMTDGLHSLVEKMEENGYGVDIPNVIALSIVDTTQDFTQSLTVPSDYPGFYTAFSAGLSSLPYSIMKSAVWHYCTRSWIKIAFTLFGLLLTSVLVCFLCYKGVCACVRKAKRE